MFVTKLDGAHAPLSIFFIEHMWVVGGIAYWLEISTIITRWEVQGCA